MTALKIIGLALIPMWIAMPVMAQDSTMDHSKMDRSKMDHSDMDHTEVEPKIMDHSQMDHSNHDHAGMEMPMDETGMTVHTGDVIIAKVNGLVCDFCAQALKKVFKKEDAVEDLTVDLDAGEVRISLKDGETLADERVKKLIRKSGYSLVSLAHMDPM